MADVFALVAGAPITAPNTANGIWGFIFTLFRPVRVSGRQREADEEEEEDEKVWA